MCNHNTDQCKGLKELIKKKNKKHDYKKKASKSYNMQEIDTIRDTYITRYRYQELLEKIASNLSYSLFRLIVVSSKILITSFLVEASLIPRIFAFL